MPELYSLHNVSYNIHILQHVVETVEYWGAPWASSAFVYEDCGGKVKKLVHGTGYVPEQMLNNFLYSMKLREFSKNYIPFAGDAVRSLYKSLDGSISATVRTNSCDIRVIGKQFSIPNI